SGLHLDTAIDDLGPVFGRDDGIAEKLRRIEIVILVRGVCKMQPIGLARFQDQVLRVVRVVYQCNVHLRRIAGLGGVYGQGNGGEKSQRAMQTYSASHVNILSVLLSDALRPRPS